MVLIEERSESYFIFTKIEINALILKEITEGEGLME